MNCDCILKFHNAENMWYEVVKCVVHAKNTRSDSVGVSTAHYSGLLLVNSIC